MPFIHRRHELTSPFLFMRFGARHFYYHRHQRQALVPGARYSATFGPDLVQPARDPHSVVESSPGEASFRRTRTSMSWTGGLDVGSTTRGYSLSFFEESPTTKSCFGCLKPRIQNPKSRNPGKEHGLCRGLALCAACGAFGTPAAWLGMAGWFRTLRARVL